MKIQLRVASLTSILLQLSFGLTSTSLAAKKAEKCTQVGSSKQVNGREYLCSYSGKNLVWKKVQTSKKTIQAAPKTFQELVGHKSIPATTWNSYYAKVSKAVALPVEFVVNIGPNTKLLNTKVKDVFSNTTRVFTGYAQPKMVTSIYYAFEDIQWAEGEVRNLSMPDYKVKEVQFMCNKSACRGASASNLPGSNSNGFDYDKSLIIFGVPGKAEPKFTYHLAGGIEAHEYAHTVQAAQFKDSKTNLYVSMPSWFVEGHAHLIGNIASADSLSDYEIRRKFWQFDSASVINEETVNGMYKAMAPGENMSIGGGGNYYFQFVYTFGYLTVELLASLKGIDSPMELLKLVAAGKSYDEAFKSIYGMDWTEAAPILAKAVVAQYSL